MFSRPSFFPRNSAPNSRNMMQMQNFNYGGGLNLQNQNRFQPFQNQNSQLHQYYNYPNYNNQNIQSNQNNQSQLPSNQVKPKDNHASNHVKIIYQEQKSDRNKKPMIEKKESDNEPKRTNPIIQKQIPKKAERIELGLNKKPFTPKFETENKRYNYHHIENAPKLDNSKTSPQKTTSNIMEKSRDDRSLSPEAKVVLETLQKIKMKYEPIKKSALPNKETLAPFSKKYNDEPKGRSSSLLEEFYVRNSTPSQAEKKQKLEYLMKEKQENKSKSAEKYNKEDNTMFHSITPNPFGEEKASLRSSQDGVINSIRKSPNPFIKDSVRYSDVICNYEKGESMISEDRNYLQKIIEKKLQIRQQIEHLDEQILQLEESIQEKRVPPKEEIIDKSIENVEKQPVTKPANKYRKNMENKKKLQSQSKEKLSKVSSSQVSKKGGLSNNSRVPIHERNAQWESKRKAKLKEQKEKREKKEMRECTFKPRIAPEPILYESNSIGMEQITPIDNKYPTDSSFGADTMMKNSNPEIKEILYLFTHIQNSLNHNSTDLNGKNTVEKRSKRL